ncbi:hypothetical protein, partial [Klebsiella pneumoniae]|uniref:hypothetical protein n=1 Tax=Klebsiella pneumoniae TaxID=573 RepID=UPI0013301FAF
MNINIEYLNGNKTIGLFFLRSEAVIPDRFKNLILLIDGLSFGTFGFYPHEGFEDELILYIHETNERVKTLFVNLDLNCINFAVFRTH